MRIRSVGTALCRAFTARTAAATLLVALAALAWALPAVAGRCYVDVTATAGANNGGSWTDAYTNLQSALTSAACTQVWVANGTYTPGTPRTKSFVIRAGVNVYGGFGGGEANLGDRNPATNVTILSGNIAGDNSYHVVSMDGTTTAITAATVLDGFSITGGDADGTTDAQTVGGGLYCDGSSGGQCSPTLSNLVFSDNSAAYGGALYNYGYAGIASPGLTNDTFSGNYASENGGAIYNYGYAGTSSPSLTDVTLAANTASGAGGAMYNDGYSGASSPTLTNVTFHTNDASFGGGMYNEGLSGTSSPVLNHVTFSDNAASYGAALYNDGDLGGTSAPSLSNVIAWGGAAGWQPVYNYGAAPTIDHSIIEGSGGSANWDPTLGSDGGGNLDANPLLGALRDNGGFTQTMQPGTGSVAIDAGTCGTSTTDQRDLPRPQGVACDIGAVEVAQVNLALSVTGSGSVDAAASPVAVSGGIAGCTSSGGPTCSAWYAPGASVTLVATPAYGYHFVDWTGACSGTAVTTSVTLVGNQACTANFALSSYTLDYSAQAHGHLTGDVSQSVLYGADGTPVTAVADAGYHFVAWDDGKTANPRTDTNVSASIDVSASFGVTSYAVGGAVSGLASGNSVIVQDNGGDNLSVAGDGPFQFAHPVAYGQPYVVTVSSQPTTPAQVCTVSAGSGIMPAASVSNVQVTCVTVTHRISTSVPNGHGRFMPAQQTVDDETVVSFTLTPDLGWHIASASGCGGTLNGSIFTTAAITADCTISASFAVNSHYVTGVVSGLAPGNGVSLENNGSDSVTPSSVNASFGFSVPVAYGQPYAVTVFAQPTTPAQTCTVAHGSGNMPDSDVTNVQVTCTTDVHTVTAATSAGHGSITPASRSVADGTSATFTVAPAAGWQIDSVSGCGGSVSGTSFTTGPITGDCAVSASFVADTHQVSAAVNGLASGNTLVLQINGVSGPNITADDTYQFQTPIAYGQAYVVSVLYVQGLTTQTCSVFNGSGIMPDSDVTNVQVACVVGGSAHLVHGSVSGGGHGSITPASQSVLDAATATLTVTPQAGYAVDQITTSGCGGLLANHLYTTAPILTDCYVTASFVIDHFALSYLADANGSISGSASQSVAYGQNGTEVSAVAHPGYHFVNWSDGSSANPRSDTQVTAGITVTANFAPNSYVLGGSINGLQAGSSVVLQNGSDQLTVSAGSTSFQFGAPVAFGSSYAVTVASEPVAPAQTCIISAGSGSMPAADVSSVQVSCSRNLSLTLTDDGDYARFGAVRDYTVTLSNSGAAAVPNAVVTAVGNAALDGAHATWQCTAHTGAATCGSSGAPGTDMLSDTASLPAGTSVTWAVSAPINAATTETDATLSVDATGALAVHDTNTLVLFRDGFDVAGAGGAQVAPSPLAAAVVNGSGSVVIELPAAPGVQGIGTVRTLRAGTRTVLVQRLRGGGQSFVRLLVRPARGTARATPWARVPARAELVLGSVAGRAGQRVLLLEGAARSLTLHLRRVRR